MMIMENGSPSLKQLLQQTQRPFHLKSYIAEKRSLIRTSSQIKTLTNPTINPSKHACFTFSFNSSPAEVAWKSPFLSPLNPSATILRVPARTAALLLEAAMRIQKQRQSSSKHRSSGFGRLFGSFLKRLRHRSSKNGSKRAIGSKEIGVPGGEHDERGRISCSPGCKVGGGGGGAYQSQALIGIYRNDFSDSPSMLPEETQFCSSPFRFALLGSPSSSGSGVPDSCCCSPAASPRLPAKEEIEECDSKNVTNVKAEDEEEKEQCSPVSILDDPFVEEDGHGSEDDQDLERSSYANVQRKKQQLLHRLKRFEKLAELDLMELERKMIECSDKEQDSDAQEDLEFNGDPFVVVQDDALLLEVFAHLNYYKDQSKKVSTDMKRLVSDLIVEEKGEAIQDLNLERIRSRLEPSQGVEYDTIDTMINVDFKNDFGMWKGFPKQVEEATAEIELEIFEDLAEELVIS